MIDVSSLVTKNSGRGPGEHAWAGAITPVKCTIGAVCMAPEGTDRQKLLSHCLRADVTPLTATGQLCSELCSPFTET